MHILFELRPTLRQNRWRRWQDVTEARHPAMEDKCNNQKNKSNADAVLMIDSPFTAGGAAVARGLDLGKKNSNH